MEAKLAYLTDMQREQLALVQLQKLLPDDYYAALSSWSIAPYEVLHICNEIDMAPRRSVVEFGTGFSTICMGVLLSRQDSGAQLIAVENDETWYRSMLQKVEQLGLADWVKLVHAPLTDTDGMAANGHERWYDKKVLEPVLRESAPIDLVVVDGPFGQSAPYARKPAIPFLKNFLADDFAIFLDDYQRAQEKEIAAAWSQELGVKVKDFRRYAMLSTPGSFDSEPFAYPEF